MFSAEVEAAAATRTRYNRRPFARVRIPFMSAQDQPWFNEQHDYSGSSIGFRVKQLLHAEKTPFQSIEIYDTTDWGKLMVIDGCTMVTTRDNFLYHEMMAHPALFTH